MAAWLKQSTAVEVGFGPFVDSTDGFTAETALTITQSEVRLKKNGGAWAQKSETTSATHEENGWYEVALNTTDTDTLGLLLVAVNESGALPVWREFLVVPANTYDALVSGTEYLYGDSFHQKWSVSGATLQPKKQDGSTNTGYSRALTTSTSSDPVTGSS